MSPLSKDETGRGCSPVHSCGVVIMDLLVDRCCFSFSKQFFLIFFFEKKFFEKKIWGVNNFSQKKFRKKIFHFWNLKVSVHKRPHLEVVDRVMMGVFPKQALENSNLSTF